MALDEKQEKPHSKAPFSTVQELSFTISTVCKELEIDGYWDDNCSSTTLVSKDGMEMVLRIFMAVLNDKATIGGRQRGERK